MSVRTQMLAFALAGALGSLAAPALGHDCSDLSDCFGVIQAALAAMVAVGGIAISLALDLTPGIGTVKGVMEAFTGRDLVTGAELKWWERVLGIVPLGGALIGGGLAGMRWIDKADDLLYAGGDLTRVASSRGAWSHMPLTPAAEAYASKLRRAGDIAEIERGSLTVADVGRLASNQGAEFAVIRRGGRRFLLRGGPTTTSIPADAKLVAHVHPGRGYWGLRPSPDDYQALLDLKQGRSVLINEDGVWRTFAADGPSRVLHGLSD